MRQVIDQGRSGQPVPPFVKDLPFLFFIFLFVADICCRYLLQIFVADICCRDPDFMIVFADRFPGLILCFIVNTAEKAKKST